MSSPLRQQRRRRVFSALLLVCISACHVARCQSVTIGTPYLQEHASPGIIARSYQEARDLSIFSQDGRQPVPDPTVYPYSAVGLLRWNDNTSCTATLVAQNFILTAAECVLDPDGDLLANSSSESEFILSQVSEVIKTPITRVHKQSEFWTKWTRNTYVLVELDDEIGATYDVLRLPTAGTFPQDKATNVQLVGYGSEDDVGMCFQLCKAHFPIEFDGPQYMIHDNCDVSLKRSPGSPMLVRSATLDTYIIGIHTNAIGDNQPKDEVTRTYSSYDDTVANRGVLGSFVQPHLAFLLQQAGSAATSASLGGASSLNVDGSYSGEISASASNFPVGSASSNLPVGSEDHRQSNPGASGTWSPSSASAALSPSSDSSSSAEKSVTASSSREIATAAAYSCIGLVCASWLAIIFIAARRFRSNR